VFNDNDTMMTRGHTKLKLKVYDIIEEPTGWDSRILNGFLILLISLNVLAAILETIEPFYALYQSIFDSFEVFSIVVFTIEYILRIWVCDINPKYANHFSGKAKYILSPIAIIDLIAIIPFYIPFLVPDLRFLRVIRFFRVFRLLKLTRYSKTSRILYTTLSKQKEPLIITFLSAIVLMILASGLIFFVEHEVRPDVYTDMPTAMWWAVVTLTTIGYGDIYPVTPIGRFLASFIAFMGVGLFALPAGIMASGFSEEIKNQRKAEQEEITALQNKKEFKYCPHCGKHLG
jgi:voltage-gated potassium channel